MAVEKRLISINGTCRSFPRQWRHKLYTSPLSSAFLFFSSVSPLPPNAVRILSNAPPFVSNNVPFPPLTGPLLQSLHTRRTFPYQDTSNFVHKQSAAASMLYRLPPFPSYPQALFPAAVVYSLHGCVLYPRECASTFVHCAASSPTDTLDHLFDMLCARCILSPHHAPQYNCVQSEAVEFCSFTYSFYPYTRHGPILLRFLYSSFLAILALQFRFRCTVTSFALYSYWLLRLPMPFFVLKTCKSKSHWISSTI